jgi:hypothetical protein
MKLLESNSFRQIQIVTVSGRMFQTSCRRHRPNFFLPHAYPAYAFHVQVTRSFGDCYMKLLEFNSAPLFPRFRCPDPYHPPYVTARPSVTVRQLQPSDRFLILASDGLWNYLENQDAVDIVQKNVRGVSVWSSWGVLLLGSKRALDDCELTYAVRTLSRTLPGCPEYLQTLSIQKFRVFVVCRPNVFFVFPSIA